MIIFIKKQQIFWLAAGLAAIALVITGIRTAPVRPVFSALSDTAEPLIVLDAGHGGEDGGAVSGDGVPESWINLAIVQRMEGVLTFLGHDTLLTRTGEEAIYSPEARTLREKKVSDLKNRVALINETEDAVMISVHQNSMPTHPGVHGAQVFFNAVEPAGQMAQAVQTALNQTVNPGNEKTTKAMDSSVYLMKKITHPGILVECGFLSHAEEARLLQQEAYQTKLALSIAASYLQYTYER